MGHPRISVKLGAKRAESWHFDLARSLRPLRDKGVLTVARGNIVHNLPVSVPRMPANQPDPADWAMEFDDWVPRHITQAISHLHTGRQCDLMDRMRPMRRSLLTLTLLLPLLTIDTGCSNSELVAADSSSGILMYVGPYTRGESKGIYAYRFQPSTGKVTPLGLAVATPNPSFVAVHPNRRYLYAVSEIGNFEGKRSGAVSAFSIDAKTGKLTLLNTVPSGGGGPCHLIVDKTGKTLLVANYGGGSVASFPVKADGSLGEAASFFQHTGSSVNPKRQQGPRAHSTTISPDNRFAFFSDLGLDEVTIYKLDAATSKMEPNDPPYVKVKPGSGPRHFTFHPNGRFGYVVNEMGSSVTAFSYDPAKGALTEIQMVSTLPSDFTGENNDAEIEVHPSGKFLYASNRGHDSIAVFSVDPKKGTLTRLELVPSGGKIPRNFAIAPEGKYLFAANQDSDNIVQFKIDQASGKLTPTGETWKLGAPVCIVFVR